MVLLLLGSAARQNARADIRCREDAARQTSEDQRRILGRVATSAKPLRTRRSSSKECDSESSEEKGLLHWRSHFRRDPEALGWSFDSCRLPVELQSITLAERARTYLFPEYTRNRAEVNDSAHAADQQPSLPEMHRKGRMAASPGFHRSLPRSSAAVESKAGSGYFRLAIEPVCRRIEEAEEPMASAMAGMEALAGVYEGLKARMDKTIEDFRANLLSVRTGRASVHMLDGIKVDYYGTDTPISQVAQITTPEASLILVQPWEQSLVTAIEKAIRTSQHGFNPMHDGKIIRIPIPPMTEERRRDAVKLLAGTVEEHKTSIRNIRRDGNDIVKKAAKDKLISADDEKRANEEIQQLTDAEIKRIEELFRAKEKEVMTI